MTTLGVHHVSINVDDVDAALAFYVGHLGLTVRSDRPDFSVGGSWLDAGGQQVHLIEGQPAPPVGQHFALRVDDLTATVARLRAEGFEVSEPIPVGPNRQCFLSDPCGNQVELHEVGGDSRG